MEYTNENFVENIETTTEEQTNVVTQDEYEQDFSDVKIEESDEKTEEEEVKQKPIVKKNVIFGGGMFIAIFLILWCILGIIAFVRSIMCFNSDSSTSEKIIDLKLLSIFFGPIYFLYEYFNKDFCKVNKSSQINTNSSNMNNNIIEETRIIITEIQITEKEIVIDKKLFNFKYKLTNNITSQ